MKRSLIIWLLFPSSLWVAAQDVPVNTQQQFENLAEQQQTETEDDSYVQSLEHFRRHPLNLNAADADELKELSFLTGLQIDNFILYRKLLGKLLNIYELQSIPGWDVETINRIVPFVTIGEPASVIENIKARLKSGDGTVLLRASEIMERSIGFDKNTVGSKYLGSRPKIFLRYQYKYKSLLQWGLSADKDAGEQFFRGSEKTGFDFYSFHLFARKVRRIEALALGDFTVNMGQGLIHWQSLAFSMSAGMMNVKRQSPVLRPYSSSGEFYFHRGAGITMRFGRLQATAFASLRNLSSSIAKDTASAEDFVSAFQTSGYHRTQSEVSNKGQLHQTAFGGNVSYGNKNWHIGLNTVSFRFSMPIAKRDAPYNLFAINGRTWTNMSVDYSYTRRNTHFFGEEAFDKNFNEAFLNGVLIAMDPKVDLAIVQRTIQSRYQAVYGNAFTENSYPNNENGTYAGLTIRPRQGLRLDMYADVFNFPWLKYLVDAPSGGKQFLVQLTYAPGKQLQIYSRYAAQTKQINEPADTAVTNVLSTFHKQDWRTEIIFRISPLITLRQRIELLVYGNRHFAGENGFLLFLDFFYKPLMKPYSANARVQYFETDSYNSRMYAYENDVLYNFSIPSLYGKGYRYYINLNFDLNKSFSFWIRWAQTICQDETSIGSGLDEIRGTHRSELKLQFMWYF